MSKDKLLFSIKAYDYEDGEIFSGKRIEIGNLTPFIIELWKNWGAKSIRASGKVVSRRNDKK